MNIENENYLPQMGELEKCFNKERVISFDRLKNFHEARINKPNVVKIKVLWENYYLIENKRKLKVSINERVGDSLYYEEIKYLIDTRGLTFDEAIIKLRRKLNIEERKELVKKIAVFKAYSDFLVELGRIGREPQNTTHIQAIPAKIEPTLKPAQIKGKLVPKDSIKRKKTNDLPTESNTPQSFKDIFVKRGWKIYIDALHKVRNPVLNGKYEFIGNPKKHKGVICSWIKELQKRSIIYNKFTRQQLARVLNKEIHNLDLGKDGRIFNEQAPISLYEKEYKNNLLKLTDLLPLAI